MILVGKAAAGPAHDDVSELLDVFDKLGANAVDVGDLRIRPDPDPVVDDATDVLGKLTVDGGLDGGDGLVQEDGDREVGGGGAGSARAVGEDAREGCCAGTGGGGCRAE